MPSQLRKLLALIVAVAAMLWLAPMAASAHEGHHAAHSVAAQVVAPERAAAPQAQAGETAQVSVLCAHEPGAGCAEGCCLGMNCCSVAILTAAPGLDPPAPPSPPTFRPTPQLADSPPASLLEPPKSLA